MDPQHSLTRVTSSSSMSSSGSTSGPFATSPQTAVEAAKIVFRNPLLYPHLPKHLQGEPIVLERAITVYPALIEYSHFPAFARQNQRLQKIALVAAYFLHHTPTFETLAREAGKDHTVAQLIRDLKLPIPPDTSELWSIPSFYLHGPREARQHLTTLAPKELQEDSELIKAFAAS